MTLSRLLARRMKLPKLLKPLVAVLAAVLAVIALALAVLWLMFDPQSVKHQAEQWVGQHTGRTLEIAGELDLVLFPRIGIALNQVRLSERNLPAVRFAAVEQVRLGVAVMPLFSGRIEADEILLVAPDIQLVRGVDGRLNIEDLAGGAAGAAQDQPPAGQSREAGAPAFRLAGVRIERGRFAYRDAAAGRQFELADVHLRTGPLANAASGALDLGGELRHGQQRLRVGLNSTYSVRLDPLALRLDAAHLSVQGQWAGVPAIDGQWKIASITLDPAALTLVDGQLRVALKLAQGGVDLALGLPRVGLSLAPGERTLTVADYRGDLNLAMPALPGGKLAVALAGEADVDLEGRSARGSARLRFDETNVQADWQLPAFSPLRVGVDASIDRLDVDRYRARPPVTAGVSGPAAAAAGTAPIVLPLPADIDVDGRLRVGALTAAGVKLTQVDLGLRLANRRLAIAPLRFELYGGRGSGKLSADAQGAQRFAVQLTLDGVDIQPLLRDAARSELLAGRGKVAVDLVTSGRSLPDLTGGLGGTASLALRDGAIQGINLARSLRELKGRLSTEPVAEAAASDARTDFSDLTASFRIARGVARNDDLQARSPFLRLAGTGDVDIAQGQLDYLARVTVVNTSTGQDGKALEHLRGVTVPLRVHGPFAAPRFRLELASLAREAAKEEVKARLGEKLGLPAGQDTETTREAAKSRLKEKLDDRLKGLLGR